MKVFQIFDKPFPPKGPYFGFMQEVSRLAEEYTLIAPVNFMGRGFFPLSEVLKGAQSELVPSVVGRYKFDAIRVKYLSEHFDHCYLDVDVELYSPIECGPLPSSATPGVMAGNGDPTTGKQCWETYKRYCQRVLRPATLAFMDTGFMPADPTKFVHHFAHGEY